MSDRMSSGKDDAVTTVAGPSMQRAWSRRSSLCSSSASLHRRTLDAFNDLSAAVLALDPAAAGTWTASLTAISPPVKVEGDPTRVAEVDDA
jgi:hypothetical protein